MQTIKVRGLVLREYEAGEADKRLLLMCKGYGRITAYARGARKPRSKFIAAAQTFTYADFVLAKGRGFHSVTQADIIESFYSLRADYDRLCSAHLIAAVCDKTSWEAADCDDLLLLALRALLNLAKGRLPLQITCVFLLRFFDVYGLCPQVDACAGCGKPGAGGYFSAEGLLCASCAFDRVIPFSKAAAAACSYILKSPLSEAFRFNAHESVLEELRQAAKLLWNSHFEWELENI